MSGRGRRAARGKAPARSVLVDDASSDDERDDADVPIPDATGPAPVASSSSSGVGIPLTAPPRPQFRGQPVATSDRVVTQPVLVARPAVPFGSDAPPADLDARMRALPSAAPPSAPPPLVDLSSRRLRQFDGTQSQVKAAASRVGVPLSGPNQSGLVPSAAAHHTVLPPVIDYAQMRETQTLRHLSIVARDALESQKQTPVEVQFGAARSGRGELLSVHAGTNNQASAEALHALMKDPVAMLRDRLFNGKPAARKAAAKILFAGDLNARRREAMRGRSGEAAHEAELRRSEEVLGHVLTGAGTRVVGNPYDRHAEQNVAEDIRENTAAAHANIAGTMIRCEGCSAAVGPHLHDALDQIVTGKVYTSQSDPASHEALLAQVASGAAHVANPSSAMPRSPSPPPWGWGHDVQPDDDDDDVDDDIEEDDDEQVPAAAAGPAGSGKRATAPKRRKATPAKRQATARRDDTGTGK